MFATTTNMVEKQTDEPFLINNYFNSLMTKNKLTNTAKTIINNKQYEHTFYTNV